MSSNDSPQPPSRVLVVRLGAMGDVVHALPAVSALAQGLPQASIDWIIEPQWAPLLAGNPHLASVIPFPLRNWRKRPFRTRSWSELRSLVSDLRKRRYDLILDLQGLIKSAVLARLAGARRRVGFETAALREPLAARFYTEQLPVNGRHVVDQSLFAVASLLHRAPVGAAFPLPPGELSPNLPADDFVLASPLAGWGAKQWPKRRYAELAALVREQFHMPLVLDCAPDDDAYVREIARAAPQDSTVVHVSTIPQLIGATRRARAVVGVDSGPLHVAAALAKPGVAIFGPTDPERNGPYGGTLTVVRDKSASTTYQRGAETSTAMSSVSAEQVCRELERLLL